MPYTANFFHDGTVFNNFFCGSEFTYPSVPSYLTGLRSTHHKMLNINAYFPISQDITLLPEIFNRNGYLTAKIGNDTTPQEGYLRGTDRYVFGYDNQHLKAPEIVNEIIDHIEAFKGTDLFIYSEFMDLHHVAGYWPLSIAVQANSPRYLSEVDNEGGSSLYQTYSPNRVEVYKCQLKYLDLHLEALYDYLRANYRKEDIVVALFSDHGNSFNMAQQTPIMSEDRINVPFMVYGGEVPAVQTYEFAESIDYRHIITKLAGIKDASIDQDDGQLPKIFGGSSEKEWIFSQSLFPDRPYAATIISKHYRFYLQSSEMVQNDCRINLNNSAVMLLDSKGNKIYDNAIIADCIGKVKDILQDFLI